MGDLMQLLIALSPFIRAAAPIIIELIRRALPHPRGSRKRRAARGKDGRRRAA